MYTKNIDPFWSSYDRAVAECHLANYGVIFLDAYRKPVDDEFELEDLYAAYLHESQF